MHSKYFFCWTVPPILYLTQCIIFFYHSIGMLTEPCSNFVDWAPPQHHPSPESILQVTQVPESLPIPQPTQPEHSEASSNVAIPLYLIQPCGGRCCVYTCTLLLRSIIVQTFNHCHCLLLTSSRCVKVVPKISPCVVMNKVWLYLWICCTNVRANVLARPDSWNDLSLKQPSINPMLRNTE